MSHTTRPGDARAGGWAEVALRYSGAPLRLNITLEAFDQRPLPPVPTDAPAVAYHRSEELRQLRDTVTGFAEQAGLPPERVADLTIAVNELASNTLEHTSGGGILRFWREPRSVVCQIDDHGQITNPFAGRIPPPRLALRGRGLVLVHQLCDLVRIRSGPAGTAIRVYIDHAAVAAATGAPPPGPRPCPPI